MAMCLNCGMIINDQDAAKHKCNSADIPAVGQTFKPTTTSTTIQADGTSK